MSVRVLVEANDFDRLGGAGSRAHRMAKEGQVRGKIALEVP